MSGAQHTPVSHGRVQVWTPVTRGDVQVCTRACAGVQMLATAAESYTYYAYNSLGTFAHKSHQVSHLQAVHGITRQERSHRWA